MDLYLFISVIATVIGVLSSEPQCPAGLENSLKLIHQQPQVPMDCVKKDDCSGFDCNGIYSADYGLGNMPFCSGVQVQSCTKGGPSLDIYLSVPVRHISFSQRVKNDVLYQIPGAHFEIMKNFVLDAYIQLIMEKQSDNTVKVGALFRVKRSSSNFHYSSWMKGQDMQLIPNFTFPLQPCKPDTPEPPKPKAPESCSSIAPPHPVPTKPQVPEKPCNVSLILTPDCGPYEMCQALNSTRDGQGRCVCVPNSHYNKVKGECVVNEPPKPPVLPTKPQTPQPVTPTANSNTQKQNGDSKNTIIIGCSVVGGLVILAMIIIPILIYVRRQRSRYCNHDILLSNEETI